MDIRKHDAIQEHVSNQSPIVNTTKKSDTRNVRSDENLIIDVVTNASSVFPTISITAMPGDTLESIATDFEEQVRKATHKK